MDLKTFQAPTMSAALAEVKSSMGPGAVILHTRTFFRHRWLGLRRQEVVEVTAGRGLRTPDRQPRRQPQPQQQPARPATNIAVAAPISTPRQQLLESPAVQSAAVVGLTQEMNGLKLMIKDLVDHARRQRAPQIPEEFVGFHAQLIRSQVCEEIATEIIQTLQRQIRPEHAKNSDFVRDKLLEQIERLLPSAGPIVRIKSAGPHVVALIGPTGVGKTTTIAKLAANLKLREKRRVGLVTIDTYRIAAIDQLRKYADILGSPLRVVRTPEDMAESVRSMRDCDFVLIDTAGRSPNDTLKLNELKTFLAAGKPDEVHLVLSTTASQSCAELAVSRFADVRMDKLIFTKLDEAAQVGSVLNIVRKVNKGISYVTTGQDVPEDIEVGKGRQLARTILGMND